MDERHFDALATAVAASPSRRRLLVGVVAGLLAGLLARPAPARRRRHPHRRRRAEKHGANQRTCASFCEAVFGPGRHHGRCMAQAAHGEGPCEECAADPERWCAGRCCQGATTCCGEECVDLATDPRHCRRCGNACPDAAACCEAGQCVDRPGTCTTCPDGFSCGPGSACCDATCCDAGEVCCPDLHCVDFQTSTRACGGCGQPCSQFTPCCVGARCVDEGSPCRADGDCCPGGDWACRNGACARLRPACQTDTDCTGFLSCCDGECTGLNLGDPRHCGACGHHCPPGYDCFTPNCRTPLPEGVIDCGCCKGRGRPCVQGDLCCQSPGDNRSPRSHCDPDSGVCTGCVDVGEPCDPERNCCVGRSGERRHCDPATNRCAEGS
jgi:hypothetical protein